MVADEKMLDNIKPCNIKVTGISDVPIHAKKCGSLGLVIKSVVNSARSSSAPNREYPETDQDDLNFFI